MHILFFVLKWIGIVLLFLVLLLIILPLFVPVRYQAYGTYNKIFRFEVKAHWLCRIVFVRVKYTENKISYRIRFFGVPINFLFDKKKKSEKTKTDIDQVDRRVENAVEDKVDKIVEEVKDDLAIQERPNKYTKNKKSYKERRKPFKQRLIDSFQHLREIIFNLFEKTRLILHFLKNDENKPGFRILKVTFKNLYHHVKPQKLKINILYGTGDPCNTGLSLGAYALIYPLIQDNVRITPDFDNKVLECTGNARGRIQLFTIVRIFLSLYFNKDFKKLWKNFDKTKEEFEYGR